ncbi:MAG TPA: 50S ribosomal protein L20, partial [Candidatus Omnitrophota bacterium]|nr:50S ribosomal protein L20 [Candidatus Omnitrophota bacterium]
MTKVKHAASSLRRKKKIFRTVKGQVGTRSKLLKTAKEAVRKSLIANYIGRKDKKGDFRALWITRITAACKEISLFIFSAYVVGYKAFS